MGRCPSLIPRKTRGFIVRKPFANTGRSTVANPSLIGGCCRSLFRPIYHCFVVVIGRCSPHHFKRALCLFRVCYRPRSGCNYQTGPPSVSRLFVLALRPSKWSEIVPFGIGRFKGFFTGFDCGRVFYRFKGNNTRLGRFLPSGVAICCGPPIGR